LQHHEGWLVLAAVRCGEPVAVERDAGGRVTIHNSSGSVHLLGDVVADVT
jgi:hypothetical protein